MESSTAEAASSVADAQPHDEVSETARLTGGAAPAPARAVGDSKGVPAAKAAASLVGPVLSATWKVLLIVTLAVVWLSPGSLLSKSHALLGMACSNTHKTAHQELFVASLNDISFDGVEPRKHRGCPASSLCTINDVFDEVIVLSLPRRTLQLDRLRSQLSRLGVQYTLLHGFDAHDPAVRAAYDAYKALVGKDLAYKGPGEYVVALIQLSILHYFKRSPHERILILEDDVLFHKNFPKEFDLRARLVPSDWLLFYLGANQGGLWSRYEVWKNEEFDREKDPKLYMPLYTWGVYALGIHRNLTDALIADHAPLRQQMDMHALPNALRHNTGRCWAMYPNPVIPDVTRSDLREGYDQSAYAAAARWNLPDFDLEYGYTGEGDDAPRARNVSGRA